MPEPQPLADHVLSIEINAPVQKVWDEITKLGKIQRALYNTVLEADLVPGGRLRYYSPNKKRVFIVGEVVEVSPPNKFSHTYRFTQKPEPPTLVTWELEETISGCRVTLTHSGWTIEHKAPEKSHAGWKEILGLLKSEIETGDIPFKTKLIYGLMGAMLFMLPKSTKTEEVNRKGW